MAKYRRTINRIDEFNQTIFIPVDVDLYTLYCRGSKWPPNTELKITSWKKNEEEWVLHLDLGETCTDEDGNWDSSIVLNPDDFQDQMYFLSSYVKGDQPVLDETKAYMKINPSFVPVDVTNINKKSK